MSIKISRSKIVGAIYSTGYIKDPNDVEYVNITRTHKEPHSFDLQVHFRNDNFLSMGELKRQNVYDILEEFLSKEYSVYIVENHHVKAYIWLTIQEIPNDLILSENTKKPKSSVTPLTEYVNKEIVKQLKKFNKI